MSNLQSITLANDATSTAKPAPLAPHPELDLKQAPAVETQAEAPKRPDHIPEKFWKDGKLDEAALLQSYAELEKQRGQAKPPAKEGEAAAPKEGEEKLPEASPETAASLKPFHDEYAQNGKLSDESFEKLAKEYHLPREYVEQYVRGLEVQRSQQESEVFNVVGGQENFGQMLSWARESLTPEQINAFNSTVETGNMEGIKLAVSGLYQQYSKAEGRPSGQRLRGHSSGSNVTAFTTTAEVTAAMSDPRYKSDPAYQAEVAERLRGSSVF